MHDLAQGTESSQPPQLSLLRISTAAVLRGGVGVHHMLQRPGCTCLTYQLQARLLESES